MIPVDERGHRDGGSFEVAVVGAGPAGAAAATTAARAGARVVLIDRAHFPRDKCCGDGLTTAALRHLERLGLDAPGLASFCSVDQLVLHSSSGRIATLPLGEASGLAAGVCRRVELDAALVDLARAAGATVLEGEGLSGIEQHDEGLRLELQGGTSLTAASVIAADGVWSTVRRALGGAERGAPQHWHAYRAYAGGVSEAASRQLLVSFEEALLPGYAWSFPLAGGHANVGICVTRPTRRPGSELAALCEASLNGPFLSSFLGAGARLEGQVRSWPIPAPIGSLPLSALSGKVLFAGDAARAADPFSGEGIAQALETGIAAAEALVSGASAAARYEEELAGALAPDQRLASWCNQLMVHPLANRAAVYLASRHELAARHIGRWLYEAYPRSLPLSPRRWGKGTASRPLPYDGAG